MTKLAWDASGKRKFETGVDRGVFYPQSGFGVPWNGLISVQENPSGGDVSPFYLDAVKYLVVVAAEEYAATVNAYMAPAEFDTSDGNVALAPGLIATQQPRSSFGFSYRTLIGNDTDGTAHGYKIHLVYGCIATPSNRENKSLSDNADPTTLSWQFNSIPPAAIGYKPTAQLTIDTTLADPTNLATLEAILYGDVSNDAQLPSQSVVVATLMA